MTSTDTITPDPDLHVSEAAQLLSKYRESFDVDAELALKKRDVVRRNAVCDEREKAIALRRKDLDASMRRFSHFSRESRARAAAAAAAAAAASAECVVVDAAIASANTEVEAARSIVLEQQKQLSLLKEYEHLVIAAAAAAEESGGASGLRQRMQRLDDSAVALDQQLVQLQRENAALQEKLSSATAQTAADCLRLRTAAATAAADAAAAEAALLDHEASVAAELREKSTSRLALARLDVVVSSLYETATRISRKWHTRDDLNREQLVSAIGDVINDLRMIYANYDAEGQGQGPRSARASSGTWIVDTRRKTGICERLTKVEEVGRTVERQSSASPRTPATAGVRKNVLSTPIKAQK